MYEQTPQPKPKQPGVERRAFSRRLAACSVEEIRPGRARHRLLDMSVGGVRCLCARSYALGTLTVLELNFARDALHLTIPATVVRCHATELGHEVGFKFMMAQTHLEEYLF